MGGASVEIEIVVEYDLVVPGDPNALEPLIRFALAEEGVSGQWDVRVALGGDATLRRLHRQFMGIDSETDVMTFPAGESSLVGGGDIAISIDRAADQAPDWGHTAWDEIRFLAIHGVLHLCGWEDEGPADRERMLTRQREIIERFDRRQPSAHA